MDPEWNEKHDRDENYPSPLSNREIQYLVKNECGGYDEYKLRNRIKEKASRFPRRTQILLNDLGYLLDGDYETSLWHDLMKTHVDLRLPNVPTQTGIFTDDELHSFEVQFGYQLGRRLQALSEREDVEDGMSELFWGLILSEVIPESGEKTQARGNLEEFQNQIRERGDNHLRNARYSDTSRQNEIHEEIERVTKEEGMRPTELLVEEQAKLLGHRPSPDESDIRSGLEFLRDTTPISEFESIRRELSNDCDRIGEISVRGTRGTDVLEAVWKLEDASTPDIYETISKPTAQNLITTVLNRLSSGPNSSAEYASSGIVRGDRSSWSTTGYGGLLCYFMFEKDADDAWLHQIALKPPQRLSESEFDMVRLGIKDHQNTKWASVSESWGMKSTDRD